MYYYVQVGPKVVAAFSTKIAFMRCVRALAPGVGVQIKKGNQPARPVPQMRPKGKARQQTIFRRESNVKFRYLKPGEFTL